VQDPGRDEHRGPCWRFDLPVRESEREVLLRDGPGFIVGVVNVQVTKSTPAPLVEVKGSPVYGDRLLIILSHGNAR